MSFAIIASKAVIRLTYFFVFFILLVIEKFLGWGKMDNKQIEKIIQTVNGNQFNFDEWYAEAWSRKQGGFSAKLANNVISYLKKNNLAVKSVLDVCSGSGEFISILRNITPDCLGVDNADGYLTFAKSKHSDVEFKKVDKLYEFKLKRKFDLVSCNRDVVNMFTTFDKWETFFKTAYNHLNKNGIFLFDIYTEKKLAGWEEVVFEQGEDLDYVSNVTQNNGLCVMSDVYYLKESSIYYRKSSDVMVEAWFKVEDVLNALKNVGFSSVRVVDMNLEPIAEEKIGECTRIHILARK